MVYYALMTKPRIAMIIGGKFPTVKAYGVTIRETLTVLSKDCYPIKVYSFQGEYTDKDFVGLKVDLEKFHTNLISKLSIYIGEKGLYFFNRFFWASGFVYSLFLSKRSMKSYNPEIVWCRHPLIALFCLKTLGHIKIILEVHDKSSVFFHKCLLRQKEQIYYFPINQENRKFLYTLSSNIDSHLAPMGVQSAHINDVNDVDLFLQSLHQKQFLNLQIGYVGKFAPQGYSKGIEDLISLAKFYKSNGIKNRITLIGSTEKDLNDCLEAQYKSDIREEFLEIKPHVNHSEAIRLMKTFDVLVLPIPNSQEYVGMPLKLVEYLASGRITIIANSELITSLFSPNFLPYCYDKGDFLSLHKAIELAIVDKKLRDQVIMGLEFALKFTWETRTRNILSLVTGQ